jgi:hypothetical protein
MYRRIYVTAFLLVLSVCFIYNGAEAADKLYKWTDKKGNEHITDYPPPEENLKKGSLKVEEEPGIKPRFDKSFIKDIVAYSPALFRKFREKSIQASDRFFHAFRSLDTSVKLALFGFMLLFQMYYSLCLYLICRKTGVSYAWLSWLPFINILPLLNSAGKPLWWFFFFIAPCSVFVTKINSSMYAVSVLVCILILAVVLFVRVWMRVFINFWINKWYGLLMLLPIIQFIPMSYCAFKPEPHRDDIRRLRTAVIALFGFFFILGLVFGIVLFA